MQDQCTTASFSCLLAKREHSPGPAPPAAGPVQTVRPRAPLGCKPRRGRRAARPRPGAGRAGGPAHQGRVHFLSAKVFLPMTLYGGIAFARGAIDLANV